MECIIIDYFEVSPGEFDDEWGGVYSHMIELRELIKRLSQCTRNQSIKLKHSWMRQKFNDVALPLEQSRYRKFNGLDIPDDLKDDIHSIGPFK